MTAFEGFPRDGVPYSAEAAGQALAGLVGREADGSPMPGMLGAGPTVKAVPAAWKVEVSPFTYVHTPGSGAVQFTGLSAAEQHDITSSAGIPSGQARIDLVRWNPTADEIDVVTGTVAVSPVTPSAGGLVPVAEVRVGSGDGAVIAGQIKNVFGRSGLSVGDVERKTVPVTLTGSAGAAGGNSWRNFVSVVFDTPFDEVPHLEVTGRFPSGAVQTMQIFTVTKTGFSGRVIRISSMSPVGGTMTYTASL